MGASEHDQPCATAGLEKQNTEKKNAAAIARAAAEPRMLTGTFMTTSSAVDRTLRVGAPYLAAPARSPQQTRGWRRRATESDEELTFAGSKAYYLGATFERVLEVKVVDVTPGGG
jgi:hypothetical protein